MKNEREKLLLTGGLTICHNFLFWDEYIGVNMLIFSILLILGLLYSYRGQPKSLNFWILLICCIISGILVVVHNSSLSKVIHILSLGLLVGFIHFPTLKSLLYAFGTAALGFISFPKQFKIAWFGVSNNSRWIFQFGRTFKLFILPILVLVLFYWIFIFANPRFNEFSYIFWEEVYENLSFVFEDISFVRFLYLILAFYLIGSLVFKTTNLWFTQLDQQSKDQLIRQKSEGITNAHFSNTLSLKTEYKMAVLMIGMVNVLLLIVNLIDIQWIWFGFDPSTIANLSQFVHEGTYLLIGSILLSMGIILFFFRSNLNFYSKNRSLKTLCYIWIIQNSILCISVALRNYHYISAFGLAYKRIGVMVFLIITIVGLITLLIKIAKTYTGFYLWKMNAWNVYCTLILCAFINWDIVIAKYNLEIHKRNLDLEFLLSLSDKTLPILFNNKEAFKGKNQISEEYSNVRGYNYLWRLNNKIENFNSRMEQGSWKSWNYVDYKAFDELKTLKCN